ncbi:hypothetical protein GCK72_004759 [Caenorhabditis remanei]|uniref:G protein-coupled receptor n=1 Tax=Caenorhabditis remanei TaxID=31234 RepID=A0A6A5HCR6_CAERE|nr:hypothetical protein GCK72_004759 [Caenorhabditis remanei]KAF1764809.1 hypothetical protein GCK72_004759 [Caenorhabditis remanei]
MWLEVTVYAEIIGFVLSVTLNLILQCLIYEMPKKTFGNYKYLMFSFSLLGIYYSCCDYWSKPNVHISEVSFAIFNVRKVTGFNKYLGVTALSIYCGCYGMMLVLLTTHFYYRFLSVTRPSKLSRFSSRNFPIWALLVLMSYLIWFGLTYFVNGSSSMKDQVLIPEFERDYCMQPDDFSYVGIQYYYIDRLTGKTRMHIPSLFSSTVYACFMTLTSGSMTYFGVKTYAHLNELTTMTSLDFRELQNQLFRTLVIQTLIPCVFMYLPVLYISMTRGFLVSLESPDEAGRFRLTAVLFTNRPRFKSPREMNLMRRQIQVFCVLRKLQSQEPSGFISIVLQFSWIDVSYFHLTVPLHNLNQLADFRFKESNIGVLVDCQSDEMFVSTEEIDLFEQTSFPLELYGELISRRCEWNSVPGTLESELASDDIDRLHFFADSKSIYSDLPILNPHNQTASEQREMAISMSKTRRKPFELSSMELHLDTIDTSLQPE